MKCPKPVAYGLIAALALLMLGVAVAIARHKPAPRGITAHALESLEWSTELFADDSVTDAMAQAAAHVRLQGGRWTEPVTWDERTKTVKDWLNGDASGPFDYGSRAEAGLESSLIGTLRGKPAAVAILWESGGGSGTFYSVGLVVERGGQAVCVATNALGDRTRVLSKKFDKDKIVLEVLRVGENDSMANPTEHVRLTYAWDGADKLALVSTEKLQSAPGK
jgi:hypothetical protein